jgi:catechol 2,3-dioxygenase-like lactoylglutathione lyase family enzyme
MTITALNHYNMIVPTTSLDAFCRFYEDVLGFSVRRELPLVWLYAAGQALVHVTLTDGAAPPAEGAGHTSGVVDHVAFSCEDVERTLDRFRAESVPFVRRDFPDRGFTQLVLRDPLGLKIELNFAGPATHA